MMMNPNSLCEKPSRPRFRAGLALCLALFLLGSAANVPAAEKGESAPDFSLKNLAGKNVRLGEQRGKYLLVNFWATWCGPCKMEMPSLEKLYNRFKGASFDLLAVSNDMFGEKVVKPYIENYRYTFPVLLDPRLEASNKYGIVTLPTTYLIDPDGMIVGVREGADDWAKPETLQFFQDLLGAPESKPEPKASIPATPIAHRLPDQAP